MEERLQKYLSRMGVASRRACESLILEGKVQVNGKTVTVLGTKINPQLDLVQVEGRVIAQKEPKIYLMLNKPPGYVTTVKDDRGRPTVMDLIGPVERRIYPVGRLDYQTRGLLILTNDGDLAYILTHPKYEIKKTYLALVKGQPQEKDLDRLRKGIMLDGRKTAPASIRFLRRVGHNSLVEIILHEGRNRQVRRMFHRIKHPVLELERTRIGSLDMGQLPLGAYRPLTREEIQSLFRLVNRNLDGCLGNLAGINSFNR
ncbi:MAG: rRNA pseudouridine synthase [Clostridia bacterium]|jgi:pseudouridine synthase|nr:rRNA pseudouridine synthase [Clostridia bacterium]